MAKIEWQRCVAKENWWQRCLATHFIYIWSHSTFAINFPLPPIDGKGGVGPGMYVCIYVYIYDTILINYLPTRTFCIFFSSKITCCIRIVIYLFSCLAFLRILFGCMREV